MDLTYAVADLHGSLDLLEGALAAIDRHAAGHAKGERKVVFLGDYVDRGPHGGQVVARLMAGPADGWRWVCLKGNHEDIMIEACEGRCAFDWWIDNGGGDTLLSYRAATDIGNGTVPPKHLDWARALPLLAVDRHRVFVHAGVDPARPLEDQDGHDLLWSRARNHLGHGGRFVVHGHTPHAHGPVRDGQSIDLDTLAWATGRLVVGVFDGAREGGPVDLIEVLRADT